MSAPAVLPRIVLCVPGAFDSEDDIAAIAGDLEFEVQGRDERMSSAFRAAGVLHALDLPRVDLSMIEKHAQVAHVLSDPFDADAAAATAHRMMGVGRALVSAGGFGVKCESSGLAHSREAWRRLCEECDAAVGVRPTTVGSRYRFWAALIDAFVAMPIIDEPDVYTCGMHLLGERDVVVDARFAKSRRGPGYETRDLLAFARYTLAESSVREGQTFSAHADAPRFVIAHHPCRRYAEDDFFFNPYGYARLLPMD